MQNNIACNFKKTEKILTEFLLQKDRNQVKLFPQEIVFIDAQVTAVDELLAGVKAGIEIVVIESNTDGVQQISQVLAQYKNQVSQVHLVCHGSPGCLYLGQTELSLDTLSHYESQLKQWNIEHLLLYGCRVAAGDGGAEFITKLGNLTNAEIAASTTITGNAALGGNWQLEVNPRRVSSFAFRAETVANYQGVFAYVSEVESNDSIVNAQFINLSNFTLEYNVDIQDLSGANISTTYPHASINGTGDSSEDYYSFYAAAGETFIFDTDDNNFDNELFLYDTQGNVQGENDDRTEPGHSGGGLPAFLTHTFSSAGIYAIGIGKYPSSASLGGFTGEKPESGDVYTIHISRASSVDSFDPGVNNFLWKQINNATANNIFSGSDGNSLYFDGAGTRDAITNPLTVTSGNIISFDLIFGDGSNGGENADEGEDVKLQYSTDGGNSWVDINTYDTEGYTSWTTITETIPAGAIDSNTQFRWSQITHSGDSFDNWGIDNVIFPSTSVVPTLSFDTATNLQEPSTNGNFNLTLSQASPINITVLYTISGTATGGADYNTLGSIVIPSGDTDVTIPVNVIDDFIDEDTETITLQLQESTGNYNLLPLSADQQQTIEIIDNDTAGITVNLTSGTTTEAGGQTSFEFQLDSEPSFDVTISFSHSSDEGTLSTSSLVFTPGNWNTEQTLTVTGQDDNDVDGDEIYSIITTVSSGDSKYNGINLSDLTITNTNDENVITGDGSQDTIRGGDGDDSISGNNEADRLFGERGSDQLFGDDGDDRIDGGVGQDELNGGDGQDKLFGAADQDTLTGDQGNDVLHGGVGDDFLDGGAGIDYLKGGEGHDTLYGGADSDHVRGNEGNDVFVLTLGDTNNRIYDYADGEDKLALELSSFTNNTVADVFSNELTIIQKNVSDSEIYANSGTDLLASLDNVNASNLTVEDFISF